MVIYILFSYNRQDMIKYIKKILSLTCIVVKLIYFKK